MVFKKAAFFLVIFYKANNQQARKGGKVKAKKIEKNREGQKFNQTAEQSSGQQSIYCPECHMLIALSDQKKVEVVSGIAHADCAITEAVRLLVAAGLPKPVGCNDLASLRRYLKEQVVQLSGLPLADPVATEKLAAVHEVAGYLLIQFNFSAIVKSARPAVTAFF